MDFTTLNDEDSKEFWRLSRFYWNEALRCEKAKAHLAGCIMLGSALETLLVLMVDCHPEEAALTNQVPEAKGKAKPLQKWTLAELLNVAKAAKWLPAGLTLEEEWNSKKARIGDGAEMVRMVRNLVHPAKYRSEFFRRRVTSKYLEQQFEIVLHCRDWLIEHNNKVLLKDLEKEETVSPEEAAIKNRIIGTATIGPGPKYGQ